MTYRRVIGKEIPEDQERPTGANVGSFAKNLERRKQIQRFLRFTLRLCLTLTSMPYRRKIFVDGFYYRILLQIVQF